MSERVKLLQAATFDLVHELLPAPLELRRSEDDAGCHHMEIVAVVAGSEPMAVWRDWHSPRYEKNYDVGKVSGLQPDFAFAGDAIEKFFSDLQAEVTVRKRASDELAARKAAEAEQRKRAAIEAVRLQLQGAASYRSPAAPRSVLPAGLTDGFAGRGW